MTAPLTQIDPHKVLNVDAIDALHQQTLAMPQWPDTAAYETDGPLQRHVLDNHRLNSLLWNEEDKARRADVPDSEIAANKRAIDGYNQRRHDAIERMDDVILDIVAGLAISLQENAWINSETAGSLIDRMSIGSLKIHHMKLHCEREDVEEEHRRRCAVKLDRLQAQRAHLGACLRALMAGMLDGRCSYRGHRQFKMYNDPTLNPYLYAPATSSWKA